MLIETIKKFQGIDQLVFLPGLTKEQISALERKLSCTLPNDIKELLNFTSGFENSLIAEVDFSGAFLFEMRNIFPHGLPIAHDGLGNFWVIDLAYQSQEWGPIFYVCHDPAVIVYHTNHLESFLENILNCSNLSYQDDLDKLQEDAFKIWNSNPNTLSYETCTNSPNKTLKEFTETLDNTYQIIDLRSPKPGDGFSWGKCMHSTNIVRYKNELLFAYQAKKSFFQKLFRK